MNTSSKFNESVEKLITDELVLRRSDLLASTANLYLRGTVLSAITAGQILGVSPIAMSCALKTSLYWILFGAFLCGLYTFWPRRKSQYTIDLLRDYLTEHGQFSILGYQKYLQEEYTDERKTISRLNWFIVAGFILSGLGFIVIAITTLMGT